MTFFEKYLAKNKKTHNITPKFCFLEAEQYTLHCTVLNRLADTTNQSVSQSRWFWKKVPVDFVRIHIIFVQPSFFSK